MAKRKKSPRHHAALGPDEAARVLRRFNELYEKCGRNQATMAKRLGVSNVAVNHVIQKGKAPGFLLARAVAWATVKDTNPARLLGWTDTPSSLEGTIGRHAPDAIGEVEARGHFPAWVIDAVSQSHLAPEVGIPTPGLVYDLACAYQKHGEGAALSTRIRRRGSR